MKNFIKTFDGRYVRRKDIKFIYIYEYIKDCFQIRILIDTNYNSITLSAFPSQESAEAALEIFMKEIDDQ